MLFNYVDYSVEKPNYCVLIVKFYHFSVDRPFEFVQIGCQENSQEI